MNCRNCAGTLTLAPGKNYHYCQFCGSFHFPESSDDGIVVLAEEGIERQCPACLDPLVLASIAEQRVLHCGNCRGVLVGNAAFRQIIDSRILSADGSSGPLRPIDPAEYDRIVNCPECERRMETHPYYGPGSVVIDTCGPCRLIWLDHGELNVVIDAHGRRQ